MADPLTDEGGDAKSEHERREAERLEEAERDARRREGRKRDAEANELYAPPQEDRPAPAPAPGHVPLPTNPALVGFLSLLVATPLCSAAAAGLMALWYNLTPIKPGFLSGLGEFLMAFFCWMALTAFAGLSGISLAAGILGREGKVSGAGWTITSLLGLLAAGVCFLPDPKESFAVRGVLGVISLGASLGVTLMILSFSRRKYIGPPPPPAWMDVEIGPTAAPR